jgi:DnaJ-class molecular chaperone with C-terminal Zn finger domain
MAASSEQRRLAALRDKLRKRVLGATNCYELLGIPPVASLNDIRAAHRYLASAFHPDRCGLAEAHDLMARTNVAYDTLTDPAKRRAHDTLHHVSKKVCATCRGKGSVLKQRGFSAKVAQPCPTCGGSGCQ